MPSTDDLSVPQPGVPVAARRSVQHEMVEIVRNFDDRITWIEGRTRCGKTLLVDLKKRGFPKCGNCYRTERRVL